jgi:KaiC/GvpD/RAD55 family RecA-like ATPase
VVIDSVMPIALFFPGEEERKKGFLKLIDNIRKWGVTTIIVAQDQASASIARLPYTNFGIENYTDGWINIYYRYNEEKGERARAVEVLKMKGVEHSTRIYPAQMDSMGFQVFSDESPKSKPAPKPAEAPKVTKKEPPKKTAASKKKVEVLKKAVKSALKKRTLGIRRAKD